MAEDNGEPSTETLRRGRDLQMDHYGGESLPYSCVGSEGLRRRLVRLGPEASGEVTVLDASCAYASNPFSATASQVSGRVGRALQEDIGPVTDELGSAERARFLDQVLGPEGLWNDRFPRENYHVSGRNSGSEGMELALRLALESRFDRTTLQPTSEAGDRTRILAFEGAWHGWTQGVRSLINRRHYTIGLPGFEGTGRFPVTVDTVPFGDLERVDAYLDEHGDETLAVVLEPIQGDAGILTPPEGFLRAVSNRCQDLDVLLVADEVMTFAKTGGYFAMTDDEGPIPTDITVIGKFLGMGILSTSLVIARRELGVRASGAVATSDLRPTTCRVLREGIGHIERNGLVERSRKMGEHLRNELRSEVVEAFPNVFDQVRGEGALNGVELTEAHSGAVGQIRRALVESGVYVEFMAGAGRRSGGHRFVFPTMRIVLPLDATIEQVTAIVGRIHDGIEAYLSSEGRDGG